MGIPIFGLFASDFAHPLKEKKKKSNQVTGIAVHIYKAHKQAKAIYGMRNPDGGGLSEDRRRFQGLVTSPSLICEPRTRMCSLCDHPLSYVCIIHTCRAL